MAARWICLVLLCLLARGWALAHASLPLAAAAARPCVEAGAHEAHAAHAAQTVVHAGRGALTRGLCIAEADDPHAAHAARDAHDAPDCRIVCELGHAPALASLWLPLAAPDWPLARPLGWHALHGVGPWPPELPPPARG